MNRTIGIENRSSRSILCISTAEKGQVFLEEVEKYGLDIILLTTASLAAGNWPWKSIADIQIVSPPVTQTAIRRAIYKIARLRKLDWVVGLTERDIESAAMIREELRLPGMSQSVARVFRDKLAMRCCARQIGIRVPSFVPILTDTEIQHWVRSVNPPWVLKPRFGGGAVGIQLIADNNQLWDLLDALGDRRTDYLLEQFVRGDVYHVDSITWDGSRVFQSVGSYGTPPMRIVQQGGVFTTMTMPRDTSVTQDLLAMDQLLGPALGQRAGVSHSEFIYSECGELYFLETSARVGGGHIADMVDAARGVNLWKEWARIEASQLAQSPYSAPKLSQSMAAGVILSLTHKTHPTSAEYIDTEIVARFHKKHQVALVVAGPSFERIKAVIDSYKARFITDFSTAN